MKHRRKNNFGSFFPPMRVCVQFFENVENEKKIYLPRERRDEVIYINMREGNTLRDWDHKYHC